MAKKKKHGRKKSKRKQNVGKNTTIVSKPSYGEQDKTVTEESKQTNTTEEKKVSKFQYEIADVRFSLIVFAVIMAIFAILYFALKNPSISDSVYGLIKL